MGKDIPEVSTPLRQRLIELPKSIEKASGIKILGHFIQSLIFTTDIVLIRNNNADAVMAVYPFTPQPVITHAIASVADKPVLMGVGGGTTKGKRVVNLALDAEFQGALAVVLNAPVDNATLKAVRKTIDIPIVISIISFCDDVAARLEVGVDILNVSAGIETPEVVSSIREKFPLVPIIATGGPTDETIRATIEAGANAISYTPPTNAELMQALMERYRTR
ncbi:MAG: hydrolase [Clostridia bacterium]|nr:hydrolase [Clostridia bacterium]